MEDKDEYQCPSCGEMKDVEKMCNHDGSCDDCQEEKGDYDFSEDVCPNCGEESIGMCEDLLECFGCRWIWIPGLN